MLWIIYLPLMLLVMLCCYITNPLVVLLSDKNGELHGIWHYWQTYDDSLDSKFMMTKVVPFKYSFLDYSYYDKYDFYQDFETLKEFGVVIDKSKIKDNVSFSLKEKLQRYGCRLLWIMRNCGYGFAYYLFSAEGNISNVRFKYRKEYENNDYFYFAHDISQPIYKRPWTCKFYKHLMGPIYIHGYLGWKIPHWHEEGKYRAMLANRIAFRLHNNDGE